MLDLFPKDNAPITIEQGNTGDCYLLTALDCIFNSGEDGLALIKSMFTQTDEGVVFRVKRTDIFKSSKNFTPEKLEGKYEYHYDDQTKEDVFFLSNERLELISESWAGARSNCLAVKIIERISSYYYTGEWYHQDIPNASVVAHNIKSRHGALSSTVFTGKFLSIDALDLESTDTDTIIKMKLMNPSQPVYISMSYGKVKPDGTYHGRHALRLDKIIPKATGGYEFVLINPWNNQNTETYDLEDIKKRQHRFSIYKTNPLHYDLITTLLKFPLSYGQQVFANPPLLRLFSALQQQSTILFKEAIAGTLCILYKEIPYLVDLFDALSDAEKKVFFTALDEGPKDHFLAYLIKNIARPEVITLIYQNEKTISTSLSSAVIAAAGNNPQLKKSLNSLAFLNVVIAAAVREKTNVCFASPTEDIRNGIFLQYLKYFPIMGFFNLSRSGSLRSLYDARIVTDDVLSQFCNQEEMKIAVLIDAVCCPFYSGCYDFILKGMNFLPLINKDSLATIIQKGANKPRELWSSLYTTHLYSPDLAKALFALASKHFDEFFHHSFDENIQAMLAEAPSDVQTWFKQQLGMEQPVPLKLIEDAMERVNKLIPHFNSLTTVSDIAAHSERVHEQLDGLIQDGSLQLALSSIQDANTLIEQAIQNKKIEISAAVKKAQQEVVAAEDVVAAYAQKFTNIPIPYLNFTNSNEDEKKMEEFLKNIKALGQDNSLIQAQQRLDYIDSLHPTIRQTIKEKRDLLVAEMVTFYVKKIDALVCNFSQAKTAQEINEQKVSLLSTLNDISGKEMFSARHMLEKLDIYCSANDDNFTLIEEAIAKKNREITSLITKQHSRWLQAEQLLESYIVRIAHPIHFDSCTAEEEVNARKLQLVSSLEHITQEEELVSALQQLHSDNETVKKYEKAIAEKKSNINTAAALQLKKITSQVANSSYQELLANLAFDVAEIHSPTELAGQLHQHLEILTDIEKSIDYSQGNAQLLVKTLAAKRKEYEDRAALRQVELTRALETINVFKTKINTMYVDELQACKNVEEVKKRAAEIKTPLNQVTAQEDLINAQQCLGIFYGKHPEIRTAISHKMELIDAYETLHVFIDLIHQMKVDLSGCTSNAELTAKSQSLSASLDAILNDRHLARALELITGNGQYPQLLQAARDEKRVQISSAASKQQQRLQQDLTQKAYAQKISLLSFDSVQITTEADIDRQLSQLSSALDKIDSELRTLNFDTQSLIVQVQERRKAIVRDAEEYRPVIYLAQQRQQQDLVTTYEQRIKAVSLKSVQIKSEFDLEQQLARLVSGLDMLKGELVALDFDTQQLVHQIEERKQVITQEATEYRQVLMQEKERTQDSLRDAYVRRINAVSFNPTEIFADADIDEQLTQLLSQLDALEQNLSTLEFNTETLVHQVEQRKQAITQEATEYRQVLMQGKEKTQDSLRDTYSRRINAVSFNPAEISFEIDIDEQLALLLSQLDALEQNLSTWEFDRETLVNQVKERRQIVLRDATQHRQIFIDAKAVLDDAIAQIKRTAPAIPFADCGSKEELDAMHRNVLLVLEQLTKNEAVIRAQQTLGMSKISPALSKAVVEQKERLASAAQAASTVWERVTEFEAKIAALPVSFKGFKSIKEINDAVSSLETQLQSLIQNQPRRKGASYSTVDSALTKKKQEIDARATQQKQVLIDTESKKEKEQADRARLLQEQARQEATALLEQYFTPHFAKITALSTALKAESLKNERYIVAAEKAQELCTRLTTAQENFLSSSYSKQEKVYLLKKESLAAINTAMDVLNDHRGWKQVLATFASVLVSLFTFGIANLATGRLLLFKPLTHSGQISTDVMSSIQAIKVQ